MPGARARRANLSCGTLRGVSLRDWELRATWLLAGLIWLVQLVHYPMFAALEPARFAEFHAFHSERITWIVLPAMAVEAIAASAAFLRQRSVRNCVGLLLLALIWLDTFFVLVPLHNQLGQGPNASALAQLIGWNWPRTLAWSARALLLSWPLNNAPRLAAGASN